MNGSQQTANKGRFSKARGSGNDAVKRAVKSNSNNQVRILQDRSQSHLGFARGIKLFRCRRPVEIVGVVLLILGGSLGLMEKGLADMVREHAAFDEKLYVSPVGLLFVQAVLDDHLMEG